MNRRGFLTRLASGVVGLSLVDVEWVPTPITGHIDPLAPLTDINAMTADFVKRLAARLPDLRASFTPGAYTVGDHGLNQQLGIDFAVTKREMDRGLNPDQYLVPAATAMARRLGRMTAFGALPVDLGALEYEAALATDEVTGVAVRGVRFFDDDRPHFMTPHWKVRFDVLGMAA